MTSYIKSVSRYTLSLVIALSLIINPSVITAFAQDSATNTASQSTITDLTSLTLSADKRVIDITDSDDKITFTATLTYDGFPMPGYEIAAINGSQLFPDDGNILEDGLITDLNGQVQFTYKPSGNREDIIDISVIAYVGTGRSGTVRATEVTSFIPRAYAQSEEGDGAEEGSGEADGAGGERARVRPPQPLSARPPRP